ncbi:hypothetical protein [Heyndrickxia ginsengihumi]|uniref:hypothetical protein n=1 Tax=Heyndrickxia ginsengihumi TaxID=363870 RepID=UPI003D1E55D0
MGYIDVDYYNNTYKGEPEDDKDLLSRYIERASDIIDQLTGYKLKMGMDFNSLDPFIQNQVKKAVSAQVEYFILNGGDALSATGQAFPNASLGKFSYGGVMPSNLTRREQRYTPAAIEYLEPTGLLYDSIMVISHAY